MPADAKVIETIEAVAQMILSLRRRRRRRRRGY